MSEYKCENAVFRGRRRVTFGQKFQLEGNISHQPEGVVKLDTSNFIVV